MNTKNKIAQAQNFYNRNFDMFIVIAENSHLIPDHLLKVLLAIVRYAPDSFPQITTIMKMSGKSKRAVIYNIQELERLNFISIDRKHRKSNHYKVSLGAIATAPKESFGCNLEQVRVQPGVVLGATALAPHHINKHINKHIKENFKNLTDEEKLERQRIVDEYKNKTNKPSSV